MNINTEKIKVVHIKDADGKTIYSFNPAMFGVNTMNDKSKELVIQTAK